MADDFFTVEKYLKGKVRNVNIPDEALQSICFDAGIDSQDIVSEVTEKGLELAQAWLYVWIAGSPTQSGGYTEEDADWRSSENGERMSASVLKNYLNMANKIFEKYDMEKIGFGKWGFVGRGFRNIRKY